MVARSSPTVSNSLADCANSSSSSGSSLTLTLRTVTVTSAAAPACSPPASSLVKVRSSPADMPGQRLVEAVQHRVAADLVGDAGRLRILDRLAVDDGGQVDRDEVTLLDRAVNALQRRESLAQRAQVFLHLVGLTSASSTSPAERYRSGNSKLGRTSTSAVKASSLPSSSLVISTLGLTEREDVVLGHRLAVQLRDGLVDRLLEHGTAADPLVDHARRDLPGPEAGNPDLPAHLPVRLVEAGLELVERHLDGEPDTGRAQLFDVGLHVGVSL